MANFTLPTNQVWDLIFKVGKGINQKAEQKADEIWNSLSEDDSVIEGNLKKAGATALKAVPWVNPVPENAVGAALNFIPVGAIAGAFIKPLTGPVKKVLRGLRAQEAPVPLQKILNLLKKEGLRKTELEDSGVLEFPTTKGNVKPREMAEQIDDVAPRLEPTYSEEWDTWTPEKHKGVEPKLYEHSQYYLGNENVPRPDISDTRKGHLNFRDVENYPIAHSRSSQLSTAKGEPTRYVSEVQSDLHQAASKLGYSKGKTLEELPIEEQEAVQRLTGKRKREIEDLADTMMGDEGGFDFDNAPPFYSTPYPNQSPEEIQRDFLYYLSRGIPKEGDFIKNRSDFKELFPHGLDKKTEQAFKDLYLLSDYGDDAMARFHLQIPYERFKAARLLGKRLQERADALGPRKLPILERQTSRHPYYQDEGLMEAAGKLEPELKATKERYDATLADSGKLARLEELKEQVKNEQYDRAGFWNYVNKEPKAVERADVLRERIYNATKGGRPLPDHLSRSITRIERPGKSIWEIPLFNQLMEGQWGRISNLQGDMDKITRLLFKAQNKANKLVETGRTPFTDVIPDIPFKKTWERQALKDELRRALDRGETKFAIARPDDLHPGVQPKAHFEDLQYDATTGVLSGVVRQTGKPFTQPVPPDKLPGYVGDTVAEELLQTGRSAGENVLKPGFRIFYEQKLPNEFEDILRRHGIEPERTDEVLGHLQDTPQQNREISRSVLAEILPNEPRLEEIAAQLGYGTAQVTELLDDVLNTPVFQRNNIVTPDMLRDSNNFFYDILTSDDLTALTSAANKYKQLFQQRLQTPRFKSLTRPTPTYNITNPAILDMVKQGFPLGALLAGILGYGQQDNVKAQERAVLGL